MQALKEIYAATTTWKEREGRSRQLFEQWLDCVADKTQRSQWNRDAIARFNNKTKQKGEMIMGVNNSCY